MSRLQHIVLIVCLAIFAQTASAQELFKLPNRHLESWNAVSLSFKPHKTLTINIEEQFRLKRAFTRFDRFFTEAEIRFNPKSVRFFRPLSFGAGVRYIGVNDDQGDVTEFENHFRFHFDFTYRLDLWRMTLKVRHRYQNRNELGINKAQGDYYAQDFRTKISWEYDIKKFKWDPEMSYESFVHFETGELNRLIKYRIKTAVNYQHSKQLSLGIFWMRETETKYWNPKINHILGFKLRYKFKAKKKEKEEKEPETPSH